MGQSQPVIETSFNPFERIYQELENIRLELANLRQVQQEPRQEKLLNSKQVCDLLQISAPTRIALAKSGRLIPMRVGRKLLYSERSVNEALKNYSKWERV